jgi:chitinase
MHRSYTTLFLFLFFLMSGNARSQSVQAPITVTAYYSGGPQLVDSFNAHQFTHIIYSFCHLKGNRLNVDDANDTLTIQKLVALKKKNPSLKVLLSLGGWGGCAPCSDVFSSLQGRTEFAKSVKELSLYFKTDGLDLDWEYPTIPGHPGHKYDTADKANFTSLVTILRQTLGPKADISFAAGGFQTFLDESVDWKKVMQQVNRVNIMSYDLVHGFSTQTGHHTPLYSTPQQHESTDNAVQYLIKLGIPANQLVIGAAFYGRMWEGVPNVNNGLYQPGKFKSSLSYKDFPAKLSPQEGYQYFWDDTAQAPYIYHPQKQLFITYDNEKSIQLKTTYALEKGLNGIMFWELTLDKKQDGLLNIIDQAIRQKKGMAKGN